MFARLPSFVILAGFVSVGGSFACAIEVTAEPSANGAVVKIDGQLFAEYVTDSADRPIVWPIVGPTGKRMTRDNPMEEHQDAATDHPHHRSLWFAHGTVNKVNFWLLPDPAREKKNAGVIKHVKFTQIASGRPATIATQNDWVAPDGKKVCEDERTLRFDTDGDSRWIDFDITMKATEGPVALGDNKEGTFAVRVAHSMAVDSRQGGEIVNSLGDKNGDAWAKRAPWVDYHGPIDGETVGLAIMNHPTSFRFPTYWHVRNYGLFSANPFGAREFEKDPAADGSHTIPAGESMTLRYRVYLHRGNQSDGKVAEAYDAYLREVK